MDKPTPTPQPQTYRVRDGYRFRDGPSELQGGDLIVLAPDVAAMHAEKIELVQDTEATEDEAQGTFLDETSADRSAGV